VNIAEFIINNPERIKNWSDDDHIIQVRKSDGSLDLVCFADFNDIPTVERLDCFYPGVKQWEVVRERMTKKDIDEFLAQKKSNP